MRCAVLCLAAACGATLPDPYDVGCAAHTDCASCLATQVDGPVPIPGLKQNCGWCFRTNSCHDNQALEGQKCELKCSAKRLPVFDGPQCPYNTCTPKYYTCDKATGKCTQTDTGSIVEICDAECAFVPPPAAAQYQCASGQCVQSATGIDLDTCQTLCNPQPPAPPGAQYLLPPLHKKYHSGVSIRSGFCTDSGIWWVLNFAQEVVS
jgi:hypothetical protein